MIRRAATAISLTCLVAAVTSGVAGAVEAQEKAVEESPFAGLAWRNIGPAFMSGRIADVAWDPTDHSVWYVGVGSGGIPTTKMQFLQCSWIEYLKISRCIKDFTTFLRKVSTT